MTQPWASLVAIGENSIETRSWGTRHRGPLVIHAAKGFPRDARQLCSARPYREVLARHGYADASDLPVGAIIAVAELMDVMRFTRSSLREVRARARAGELPPHEADFGDFSPGRYGWVLGDIRALSQPVPVRGMLGVWEVPAETQKKIDQELARK